MTKSPKQSKAPSLLQRMKKKLKKWSDTKNTEAIKRTLSEFEGLIIEHNNQIKHEQAGIDHLNLQLKERNRFLGDLTKNLQIEIKEEEAVILLLRTALNLPKIKKGSSISLEDRLLRFVEEKGQAAIDKNQKLTKAFRDWELLTFKNNQDMEE